MTEDVCHSQGRCRIDPIALPARRAQAAHGRPEVYSPPWVLMSMGSRASAARSLASCTGSEPAAPISGDAPPACEVLKKIGSTRFEVPLRAHSVEKHRSHHAAPTDDADLPS